MRVALRERAALGIAADAVRGSRGYFVRADWSSLEGRQGAVTLSRPKR